MTVSSDASRKFLAPLVHLSNNWLSLIGVVIVTTATVLWLFLLPTTLRGQVTHPYVGILVYLLLPVIFVAGLVLIPLGMLWQRRRENQKSLYPRDFPPLTWANPDFRRLAIFIALTTVANFIIGSQFAYGAVNYMDSVEFCGATCHVVMQPEFSAYQNSPHSRVECAACHIGPGASWFVKSKLAGTGQLFAVMFNTYPRPVPSPVESLRPARETCEVCHWPQRSSSDLLRVVPHYAEDATNSSTKTVLLLKVGGGDLVTSIHGMHVGSGVRIRYAASDESRQTIPWVEYTSADGHKTTYSADPKSPGPGNLPIREMDCIDCHNRPSHAFQLPDRALDQALAAGEISPALPFVKKQGLALLKKAYASQDEAAREIPAALASYYQKSYPDVYQRDVAQVANAGKALVEIYSRNVFPAMKVTWGTHPNNIGHTDFPGCFRCHDGSHTNAQGTAVSQDCAACHNLLAVDEAAPKILTDLGMAGAAK
ncbi:MAG TPA: NapC/NirT family cytochrome c [Bryobacteraceae bacterium]|nr:NapC/NirT family cytochrome c [Bryobacteraceae bacterium]